jgi:hypothetical protein
VVVPDGLDGAEEAVTLHCALNRLGTSTRRRGLRPARAGEGGNDALFCQLVQVLRDNPLHAVVQLIAVCSSAVGARDSGHARLYSTMLYA